MDSSRNQRRILSGLKTIRRRAGKVRDMDVLTMDAVGLGLKDDPDCVVRLTHYLGVQRHRHAVKLYSDVRQQAPEVRQRLKQERRKLHAAVERFAHAKFDLDRKGSDDIDEAPLHALSEALRLSQELSAIPRLGRDNLHAYRLEVKRLRYILELAAGDDGQQKAFIDELKQVQDLIGEWHDWVELSAIANNVLKRHGDCKLIKKIEEITQTKFKEALHAAEEMRKRYLRAPQTKSRSSRRGKTKSGTLPGPVLVAASEIVA